VWAEGRATPLEQVISNVLKMDVSSGKKPGKPIMT
jgi:hypothetical protein